HRGDAGLRLDQEIIGLAPGIGTALAVARDRAANQARVVLAQAADGKSKFGQRAWLEVLHKYVGLREHGLEKRLVLGLAEIEHDRLLAPVEPHEISAFTMHHVIVSARKVALRPLDLNDPRAGVSEPARALRRGHRLLDRNDKKIREGEHHYSVARGETSTWRAAGAIFNKTSAIPTHARPGTRESCWWR